MSFDKSVSSMIGWLIQMFVAKQKCASLFENRTNHKTEQKIPLGNNAHKQNA